MKGEGQTGFLLPASTSQPTTFHSRTSVQRAVKSSRMLCDICKEREPKVHLTQYVDNSLTRLDLCEECAKARTMNQPVFLLRDLLNAELQSGPESPGQKPDPG